jgi:hypothetical protein
VDYPIANECQAKFISIKFKPHGQKFWTFPEFDKARAAVFVYCSLMKSILSLVLVEVSLETKNAIRVSITKEIEKSREQSEDVMATEEDPFPKITCRHFEEAMYARNLSPIKTFNVMNVRSNTASEPRSWCK